MTQQASTHLAHLIGREQIQNGIYTLINPLNRNLGTINFAKISKMSQFTSVFNANVT